MPTLIPFSPQEAVTKVRKRVRVVRWDLPPATQRTWEQWFGKTKYEAYLAEIDQGS